MFKNGPGRRFLIRASRTTRWDRSVRTPRRPAKIRYAPPMTEPAPDTASTAYDLHYLVNGERLFWRSASRGLTLIDGGRDSAIAWRTDDGEAGRQLWTDIVSVNMPGTDGKDAVSKCRIDFRGGRFLVVTDAGTTGKVDHARTPVYRDFVRALHLRLADAPEGSIRFTVGVSQTYRNVMVALGVITALLFVATPAVLVVDLHEWRALGPLTAGATFIWPFWKKIGSNRPHVYDPRHPPDEPMD
ncbi:conserved hypothetical protein [Nitrobacter hamburgensis X14]|uniref:Uncharacterized protein n=2 Tax=Nitrobacter hamburgensis TaxID=912 RepID=Q1QJG4_NITHX|nr:conserved hypothetical protein [Nitrobacter hamburgensis X14]